MSGYIDYVKSEQPKMWSTFEQAAKEGLIYIDEQNDAVTATNRLLLTYPGLHEVLNMLAQDWALREADKEAKQLIQQLINKP